MPASKKKKISYAEYRLSLGSWPHWKNEGFYKDFYKICKPISSDNKVSYQLRPLTESISEKRENYHYLELVPIVSASLQLLFTVFTACCPFVGVCWSAFNIIFLVCASIGKIYYLSQEHRHNVNNVAENFTDINLKDYYKPSHIRAAKIHYYSTPIKEVGWTLLAAGAATISLGIIVGWSPMASVGLLTAGLLVLGLGLCVYGFAGAAKIFTRSTYWKERNKKINIGLNPSTPDREFPELTIV